MRVPSGRCHADQATGTSSGCNSVVECLLPKQNVVGSNPITRSNSPLRRRTEPEFSLAILSLFFQANRGG